MRYFYDWKIDIAKRELRTTSNGKFQYPSSNLRKLPIFSVSFSDKGNSTLLFCRPRQNMVARFQTKLKIFNVSANEKDFGAGVGLFVVGATREKTLNCLGKRKASIPSITICSWKRWDGPHALL